MAMWLELSKHASFCASFIYCFLKHAFSIYYLYSREAQKCYCGADICSGYIGGAKQISIDAYSGKSVASRKRKGSEDKKRDGEDMIVSELLLFRIMFGILKIFVLFSGRILILYCSYISLTLKALEFIIIFIKLCLLCLFESVIFIILRYMKKNHMNFKNSAS